MPEPHHSSLPGKMIIPCTCMIGSRDECPQHGIGVEWREKRAMWAARMASYPQPDSTRAFNLTPDRSFNQRPSR
jgi:hypothetical protein